MRVQARKLEFQVRVQRSVQDNFRVAIDLLRNCNVVEHHRAKTAGEEGY
jgi:hypothetical protein